MHLILLVIALLFPQLAWAHDENHEHDDWYAGLRMPDAPLSSCCGLSDAYYADEMHIRGGKVFVTITDTREDQPLNNRPHIPVGTEFEVPDKKLTWKDGNPTGHAILFVGSGGVYCYVQGSGI